MTGLRSAAYFGAHLVTGDVLTQRYLEFRRADVRRDPPDTDVRLRRLLRHARAHVPYYARTMPPLHEDDDVRQYLATLPLLTKDLVRENWDDLVARDGAHRRTRRTSSGGSTGAPVVLLHDGHHWDASCATQLLHCRWAGRTFGDPEVYVWGQEQEILEAKQRPSLRAADALGRRTYVNAFRLSEQAARDFFRRLQQRPPALVVSYAQALFELARTAEREGIDVPPQRAVVVTSETLFPFMRTQVERVFGCRVLDRYGCHEVGEIAGECPEAGSKHVFPWSNFIEVVDEQGRILPDGVEGEVAVTCLTNRVMPLIRYRLGDRTALSADGPCCCGRQGQVLTGVVGRTGQVFRLRNGGLVDGGYFGTLLDDLPWLRAFQVEQLAHDHVQLRLQLRAGAVPAQHDLDGAVAGVRLAMGDDCRVDLVFPPELPRLASGKYAYVTSRVTA